MTPSAPEKFYEPQPLRFAIGPSPWGFRDRSMVVNGISYHFRDTLLGNDEIAGCISLQDSSGATFLVLDFYCYARILSDGVVLLWRESGEKAGCRIVFDSFHISSLQRVSDPRRIAAQIREKKLGIAPLQSSERWEFSSHVAAGAHRLSLPHNWSRFEETLVLADYADSNGYDKMARAIFAFDWIKRQVEVLPQDWFNTGDYDFGYQWITRVARRTDGSIVGDGIRLGTFELDNTNRRVRKWSNKDPFYMIQ